MRSPPTGTVEDTSSALFPTGRPGISPGSTTPVGGLRMAYEFVHTPVLVDEVVTLLATVPSGVVVDATVGGGGHAAAILDAYPGLGLLGLDRDPAALAAAAHRLRPYGRRAVLRHARFGNLAAEVAAASASGGANWPSAGGSAHPSAPYPLEAPRLVGVVLDLGVSSPQLDQPERGFSYRSSGPLDMRMDPTTGRSALELVNEAGVDELAEMFAANGERRLGLRIARAVVGARPLATTAELADVVAGAVPAAARRRGHPARRVFQALRIAVNDELEELAEVLPAALAMLVPGGRLVVVSYHSGEDRLVKKVFAEAVTGGCTCPPGLPCACGAVAEHRLVFRGSHGPSPEEIAGNHRAASARLRAVERLGARR